MIIYRLVLSAFKDDLSGFGASLYGGRWNSKGIHALYAAEHISLCMLELLVNMERTSHAFAQTYHLLELEVPDDLVATISVPELKKNWSNDVQYTQFIGDSFLGEKQFLGLKIPSSVIQEESNFILNPAHPEFKKLKLKASRKYSLDSRLKG